MRHARRWIDREDDQAGANRQTASLGGLALVLLLVIVCLLLVRELQYKSTVEDCLLSGRSNCGDSGQVLTPQNGDVPGRAGL
jgi:hypothetical protein